MFGKKGRGKDLLFGNVIQRRSLPYCSNIDYGGNFYKFDYNTIDCGTNTYKDFINGTVKYYSFPYPDGTDIYLSDCGIYFPSQFCNELNKQYLYMSVFQAISRHVGLSNFHVNAQALNRVWDKIREQSDIYILCRRCIYFHGLVFQWITTYDRYDAAVSMMKPLQLPKPLISNRELRLQRSIQVAQFEAAHGTITNGLLIYRNKSSYDTRYFKKLLEEGTK